MFYKLSKELRNRIYIFALSKEEWKIEDISTFDELNFTEGMSDSSDFYFSLSKKLTVLRINRQMRQETLPLAYRRTVFHLNDMNDLIKLLIAVGKIGRDSIESLKLTWKSRVDSECKWDEASNSEDSSLTLSILHVVRCVQLLKQCKRLTFLRLYFERDLINDIFSNVFKADSEIRELCFLREIERVEIWGLNYESLEQRGLVKCLKKEMKSSEKKEENEKELDKQDTDH